MAGTVGAHHGLALFLTEQLAALADRAWAPEAEHRRPAPLADRFSAGRFRAAADLPDLISDLEAELHARLESHPTPLVALEAAMEELATAGHGVERPAYDVWLVDLAAANRKLVLELGAEREGVPALHISSTAEDDRG